MARGIQQLYPDKPLNTAFYGHCNAGCDDTLSQRKIDPNSSRETYFEALYFEIYNDIKLEEANTKTEFSFTFT